MNKSRSLNMLALAPFLVAIHIAEEAPGLVDWYNRHTAQGLTMDEFITFNIVGLLITLALVLSAVRSRHYLLGISLIAWLSFVMLSNGCLHIVATIYFREYAPGTFSAIFLYLPYFMAAFIVIRRQFEIRTPVAFVSLIIGAAPMIIQGVGIMTTGSRMIW